MNPLSKSEKNLKEVQENYKKFKEATDYLYNMGYMVIELDIEGVHHVIPSKWITNSYKKSFEKLIEYQNGE